MSLPVIELPAEPAARGRAHGEAARELVAHNVEVYFERFEREALLPRDEALARTAVWWARIEAAYPEDAAAIRGIAEGSGRPLPEIVALNVRYELLYSQFTANAMSGPLAADGCTAFAALPEATADGHTLIGQNWDWIPEVRGVVLREPLREGDGGGGGGGGGGEMIAFSEAGIDGGKIGLNSHGVGLAINGITSSRDAWGGDALPFHLRCRRILRSRDLDEAAAWITGTGHATAANYLVAQSARPGRPARALDVEAAPHVCWPLHPRAGTIVHTNHFVEPEAAGVEEPPSDYRPHSVHRRTRLQSLLDRPAGAPAALDVEGMMRRLRDHDGHPNSVCRHPDPTRDAAYRTVVSAIMDLDAGALWITDGPPCEGEYELAGRLAPWMSST